MSIISEAGGFSVPKKVGAETKTISIATLRFKSEGHLDVTLTGDGSLTTLQLIKQVGAVLAELVPPVPADSHWNELTHVPSNGSTVVVSFAVRTECVE